MKILLLLVSASALMVYCLPPPHPAVVAVRHQEEQLPPHLRSPALHNPHLREILPLTSLLHKGENFVFQRDADNVTRQEIYNILTHAGFLPRRPGYYKPPQRHHHHKRPQHGQQHQGPNQGTFFEPPPYFHNPELLQHL